MGAGVKIFGARNLQGTSWIPAMVDVDGNLQVAIQGVLEYSMKSLADGQLAATKATLYTVPADTETIITCIKLVNTDSSARTVNLYIKVSGGSSRRVIPNDMSLGIGYMCEEDQVFTLEAGDVIEGDASVATVVDYSIFGVQVT